MRVSCHNLDRLDVTFDDEHLVANAGLLLPATLAQHLGLRELFDEHIDALAKRYMGVEEYPMRQPGEQRLIVKVEPERVQHMAP